MALLRKQPGETFRGILKASVKEVDPEDYKRLKRIERPRGAPQALGFPCSFHEQHFSEVKARHHGWLVDALNRSLQRHESLISGCLLAAYVNHVHLLVWPRTKLPSVSNFLESLKKSVTKKAGLWGQGTHLSSFHTCSTSSRTASAVTDSGNGEAATTGNLVRGEGHLGNDPTTST